MAQTLQLDTTELNASAATLESIADISRAAAKTVGNGTVSGDEFGKSSNGTKLKSDWNKAVRAREKELLKLAALSESVAETLRDVIAVYDKSDAENAELMEFRENLNAVVSLATGGKPDNIIDVIEILINIGELLD